MIFSSTHPINQLPAWESGDHWNRHLVGGRGIICGFEWFMEKDCTLRLCGGTGITSDGTLVCTDNKQYHFTHCRPFVAPDYSLFSSEGKAFQVWELLEGRPANCGDEVTPLTPQNEVEEQNLRLNEKVVIAFLDRKNFGNAPTYKEEPMVTNVLHNAPAAAPKEALAYNVRFLLMNQEDIIKQSGLEERVNQLHRSRLEEDEDYIYSEDFATDDDIIDEKEIYQAADVRLDWPEIRLGRFGYGCLDAFDCEPGDLEKSDFPGVNPSGTLPTVDDLYSRYVCIVDSATKELDQSIGQLQGWLGHNFYCFENPEWAKLLELLCAKWEAYKSLNKVQETEKHKKEFVQYFYDWCRDLIKAYDELRKAVMCWSANCRAEVEEHPSHLFIGLAMRSRDSYFPPAFRHAFQSPPSFHDAAKLREEVRIYHYRLLSMIQGFYLPNAIPDEAINPFCAAEWDGNVELLPEMSDIKVTPGRYYDQALGLQSIPFYYPLSDDDALSPHRFWDPRRSRSLKTNLHRSYHASTADGSYSILPQVTHPLRFNIDEDDFIRVEGHIGQITENVINQSNKVDQFKELRERHNLSFAVKLVKLSELFKSEESKNYFADEYQGAEHLAGVLPGGTLILVYDKIPGRDGMEVIIADFSLPYYCCLKSEDKGDSTGDLSRNIMNRADKIIKSEENRAAIVQADTKLSLAENIRVAVAHTQYAGSIKAIKSEKETADTSEAIVLNEATKYLTIKYLDKVIALKPEKLTTGSINTLKATAKKNPDIDFTSILSEWRKAKGDAISPDFAASLEKVKAN